MSLSKEVNHFFFLKNLHICFQHSELYSSMPVLIKRNTSRKPKTYLLKIKESKQANKQTRRMSREFPFVKYRNLCLNLPYVYLKRVLSRK